MNDLHFALCMGINRYPGFPGRDLSSAVRDAIAFRDWLVAPAGGMVPAANVSLVTVPDDAVFGGVLDARPKLDEVLLALDDINERIRNHLAQYPADWDRTRLYIYAAGHGVAVPNSKGAVLMANAKPTVLGFNLDLSLYANWYLECALVREVVVFADCCREVPDGMSPGFLVFRRCGSTGKPPKPTVHFIAYASRHGGQAWEPIEVADPNQLRGFFTEALIDGLNGAAAEESTGEVTAASLATYVSQAVEQKTQPPLAPYPQKADMQGELATRLVLRGARPQAVPGGPTPAAATPPSHTANIRFPIGFVGEVSVQSSNGTVHGRWRASDGEWRLTLPDSFYQVVADPPAAAAFAGRGLFALVGADADVQL